MEETAILLDKICARKTREYQRTQDEFISTDYGILLLGQKQPRNGSGRWSRLQEHTSALPANPGNLLDKIEYFGM